MANNLSSVRSITSSEHHEGKKQKSTGEYRALVDSGPQPSHSQTQKQTLLVNTSPGFVAFGFGESSCPGRSLAAFELKLLISKVIRNIDLSLVDGKAANVWGHDDLLLPALSTKLRLIKRAAANRQHS